MIGDGQPHHDEEGQQGQQRVDGHGSSLAVELGRLAGGLVDDLEHVTQRQRDEVQHQRREEAQEHGQHHQRRQRRGLDGAHVGELRTQALQEVGDVSHDDVLDHVQQVHRREDDGEGGDVADDGLPGDRAQQHQELAHEAGQAGQAGRGQAEEHHQRGEHRHALAQPAHLGDGAVVGSLVDDADEEEERAGDDAVGDHLEDRALHALLVEDEDAQGHEAHVADRGVGDESLQVGLADGHDGAVEHADDREQR